MARINNLTDFLTDVASAIKTKKGSQTDIPAEDFDTEIASIDTLNGEQITINPSTSSQVVTPTQGHNAITQVTVPAVTSAIDANITQNNIKAGVTILGVAGNLEPDKPDQTKTVTPTTSEQTITPDTGYELASVVVAPVTSAIDSDIQAGNIKKDVVILGVTGNYEGTVINNQNKTVSPTTSQQVVTADNSYTGLGQVTINAVTSAIDANIIAGNIKNGVTILGVTGTYEGSGSAMKEFASVAAMNAAIATIAEGEVVKAHIYPTCRNKTFYIPDDVLADYKSKPEYNDDYICVIYDAGGGWKMQCFPKVDNPTLKLLLYPSGDFLRFKPDVLTAYNRHYYDSTTSSVTISATVNYSSSDWGQLVGNIRYDGSNWADKLWCNSTTYSDATATTATFLPSPDPANYYIKNTTMVLLVKETETLTPAEYNDAVDTTENILGIE